MSDLTCFSSVLEGAVGGAPDDASQGWFLTLNVPCLRVCTDVSDLLSWSLSRVHLFHLDLALHRKGPADHRGLVRGVFSNFLQDYVIRYLNITPFFTSRCRDLVHLYSMTQ